MVKTHLVLQVQAHMPDLKTTNKLERVLFCRGAKIRGLESTFDEGKLCLVPLMCAGQTISIK